MLLGRSQQQRRAAQPIPIGFVGRRIFARCSSSSMMICGWGRLPAPTVPASAVPHNPPEQLRASRRRVGRSQSRMQVGGDRRRQAAETIQGGPYSRLRRLSSSTSPVRLAVGRTASDTELLVAIASGVMAEGCRLRTGTDRGVEPRRPALADAWHRGSDNSIASARRTAGLRRARAERNVTLDVDHVTTGGLDRHDHACFVPVAASCAAAAVSSSTSRRHRLRSMVARPPDDDRYDGREGES